MRGETVVLTVGLTVLLGFLLFLSLNEIVGYRNPEAKVRLGSRVGRDGSHAVEKLATGLLANAVGIVGIGLALCRRPILGFPLIGTCYLLDAARDEVFWIWEGGPPFDKDHLGPWMYLLLGLLMFWVGFRQYQKRQEALAVLEEIR